MLLCIGNAVKRATEALVKAAQQVKEREDEANVQVNKRMVGGVAQVIINHFLGLSRVGSP